MISYTNPFLHKMKVQPFQTMFENSPVRTTKAYATLHWPQHSGGLASLAGRRLRFRAVFWGASSCREKAYMHPLASGRSTPHIYLPANYGRLARSYTHLHPLSNKHCPTHSQQRRLVSTS